MGLQESDRRTWQFDVKSRFALDAPQKAKSKVAEEHDVDYRDLRARIVYNPGWRVDPVVVVAEVK